MIPLNDLRRHNSSNHDEFVGAVAGVLGSGWYVLGTQVEAFEREFAAYCGVGHAVGVGNGTDALELALRALGVRGGQSVVTVANAGMYATSAIIAIGAEPTFVDIDEATLCVDVDHLERALAGKPAAVVVTHLYGRLADIASIVSLASKHDVPVIEDCAQAHGATIQGRKAGSFGDIGCFSFYPTKNLGALGDGGAVVTSSDDLAVRLRRLRQYGWSSKYVADTEGGRNSRLDEIQAAFLRVKLRHLDAWNAARRSIARRYSKGILNPQIALLPEAGDAYVAHLFVVRTTRRDSLKEHLRACGISSDVHYPIPDHRQASFAGRTSTPTLPRTDLACEQVLTIPCFPEMTDHEVEEVIDACNRWVP